ncbi:MAG: glycoside hydrolase family 10 protein [Snowella sp.]|nr:glycoside hydrolase family 10 protein [Snowella sp.]
MKALFRLFKKFPVHLFAVALILVIIGSNLSGVQAQSNFQKIRGVWITNNDTTRFMDQRKLQESVDFLAQLNFNTLYPVIWNSGYVLYESAIAQREGIQPFSPRGYQGQDVLADLIEKSHQKGMLVVPWFEFGFMAPTTSELVTRHPQWVTQRRDGSKTWVGGVGEVVWLNPFHPQVQKFVTDLILEMVNKYDLDGVQFDDHMCLPNEFGYDPYTISLYTKETKKAPPANPRDPAWMRWRANKITAFMTELHKTVKAQKSNILFSVSPATYSLAYNTYLQDWLDWIRKGIVDEVIVQVYRSELPHFLEPLSRPEFQEAKTKIPTAVGILTGLKTKPIPMPLIDAKVRAADAQGLGVSFFYYKTLWDIAPESTQERRSYFLSMFSGAPAPRSLAQRIVPTVPVETPQGMTAPNPPPNLSPSQPSGITVPVNTFQNEFQDNFPPEPTL